jgi:hypothetical protein
VLEGYGEIERSLMRSLSCLPVGLMVWPRSKTRGWEGNQRHALLDSLLLTVCAVVSGADGWEAIEEFGRAKLDWLRRCALFDNGVPSHDCIASVIARLTPKVFGDCCRS